MNNIHEKTIFYANISAVFKFQSTPIITCCPITALHCLTRTTTRCRTRADHRKLKGVAFIGFFQ